MEFHDPCRSRRGKMSHGETLVNVSYISPPVSLSRVRRVIRSVLGERGFGLRHRFPRPHDRLQLLFGGYGAGNVSAPETGDWDLSWITANWTKSCYHHEPMTLTRIAEPK